MNAFRIPLTPTVRHPESCRQSSPVARRRACGLSFEVSLILGVSVSRPPTFSKTVIALPPEMLHNLPPILYEPENDPKS